MQENELILDYEEFSVCYDSESRSYIYTNKETKEKRLVEPIAILTYDINTKMQWFADFEQIFLETFCSGEKVTDDEIIYWWFKEIE